MPKVNARALSEDCAHCFRALRRISGAALRVITRKRCQGFSTIASYVDGKYGLEIGGPSQIFRGSHLIPLYGRCRQLDNCNFSEHTIWSAASDNRKFGPKVGKQFVAEACNLSTVSDEMYDFVLASHVLEHIANPLQALQEWKRVLKPNGVLVIVVPHKAGTFDHRRSFTPLEHIESDFATSTSEDDLTHLNEVLELHDLDLDPRAGSWQQFRDRCLQNASVRGMHHHVLSPEALVRMLDYVDMLVLNLAVEEPFHIIGFARKIGQSEKQRIRANNRAYLAEGAEWRRRDPFSPRGGVRG
jgi:SAM-dependent methyltransferase